MKKNYPVIFEEFINYLRRSNLSESTIKSYGYDIELFFKYMLFRQNAHIENQIDSIDISNFSLDILRNVYYPDIIAFIQYIRTQRNNSASAINRKISCLNTFYHYAAYEKRYVNSNPCKEIKLINISQNNTKEFQLNEYLSFIENISGNHQYRDRAIISILVFSAVKLSELINIKIDDIDFNSNKIYINGLNKRSREIIVKKQCIHFIIEYMNKERTPCNCDYVFISQRKKQISPRTVQHIIKTHSELHNDIIDDKISSETIRKHVSKYLYGNQVKDISD